MKKHEPKLQPSALPSTRSKPRVPEVPAPTQLPSKRVRALAPVSEQPTLVAAPVPASAQRAPTAAPALLQSEPAAALALASVNLDWWPRLLRHCLWECLPHFLHPLLVLTEYGRKFNVRDRATLFRCVALRGRL